MLFREDDEKKIITDIPIHCSSNYGKTKGNINDSNGNINHIFNAKKKALIEPIELTPPIKHSKKHMKHSKKHYKSSRKNRIELSPPLTPITPKKQNNNTQKRRKKENNHCIESRA